MDTYSECIRVKENKIKSVISNGGTMIERKIEKSDTNKVKRKKKQMQMNR